MQNKIDFKEFAEWIGVRTNRTLVVEEGSNKSKRESVTILSVALIY